MSDHPRLLLFPLALSLSSLATAQVGERYCTASPNSTGGPAQIDALGSAAVELDRLSLSCTGLPVGSVGYFLVSRTPGFAPNPSGSGNLCLSGAIGRYSGQVLTASALGEVARSIDLGAVPLPGGPIAVLPGDTLRFQYWHRDTVPGSGATSNTSDAIAVTFHCGERPFPLRAFPVASSPHELELADLDMDGDLDAVVICASSGPARLEALRNDGLGNFAAATTSTLLSSAVTSTPNGAALALGDFDGDGKIDAAVALPADRVAIVRGNGDGTFGNPSYVNVPGVLRALRAGDLDGDGDLDLALLEQQSGEATWLRNVGGAFAVAGSWNVGLQTSALELGDLDGDGIAEAVTTHTTGIGLLVSWVATHTDISSGAVTSTLLPNRQGGAYLSLALADLDLDGVLDIVAGAANSREFDVYSGLGALTFAQRVSYPASGTVTSVKVADVNADGRPDLIGASNSISAASVCLALAGGGFGPSRAFAATTSAWDIALGDLDGDGHLDLVASELRGAAVTTAFGLGNGSFESRFDFIGLPSAIAAAFGDLDGDGKADVVTLPQSFDELRIDFDPTGPLGANSLVLPTIDRPTSVTIVDLNRDGSNDIVYTNRVGEIHALEATPAGFAPRLLAGLGVQLLAVRAVNLDADPELELAVLGGNLTGLALLDEVGGVYVTSSVQGGIGQLSGFALADFDGDGDIDLALASAPSQSIVAWVTVRPNLGNGTFGASTSQRVGRLITGLIAADIDADGAPELVLNGTTSTGQRAVFVLPNDGAGQFADPRITLVAGNLLGYTVGDFDGDGRADVALADRSRGACILLRGRTGFSFAPRELYTLQSEPLLLESADFDGDGRLDLATLTNNFGVSIVLNQCQ